MIAFERSSAELDRLLETILAEVRACPPSVEPGRVIDLALAIEDVPPWPGGGAAERELLRVHLCELAFLLREAARRCAAWSAGRARDWCDLVDEALLAARCDGLELRSALPAPVRSLLAQRPVGPAPIGLDAADLARASLVLAEHPLGRLELARILLAKGEPLLASGVLATALHGIGAIPGAVTSGPWPRLVAALVRAQEHAGRASRAEQLRRWLPERVA